MKHDPKTIQNSDLKMDPKRPRKRTPKGPQNGAPKVPNRLGGPPRGGCPRLGSAPWAVPRPPEAPRGASGPENGPKRAPKWAPRTPKWTQGGPRRVPKEPWGPRAGRGRTENLRKVVSRTPGTERANLFGRRCREASSIVRKPIENQRF